MKEERKEITESEGQLKGQTEVCHIKYCISFVLALSNDFIYFHSSPLPSVVQMLFFISETKLMRLSITYQSRLVLWSEGDTMLRQDNMLHVIF